MHQNEVWDRGEKTALGRLWTATEMGEIVVGVNDVKLLLHHLPCSVFTLVVYLLFDLFSLLYNNEPVTKPQSTTQDVIWRLGRTYPRNEPLHIFWRKRKVLHHHLSWHRRWWNCDRLRLVGDSDVWCLLIGLKLTRLGMTYCNTVSARLVHIWQKLQVPNGRCDLGSLNSVVAVFSGRVTFVLNFGNLQFL